MLSTVIHLIKRFSRLTFRPIFKIPRTVAGQMSLTYHKLWLHVKTFVLFHSFSHWRIWPNIRISLSCYLKDMWAYTKNTGAWQVTDPISQYTHPDFATVFNYTRYAKLQAACLCPKILFLWNKEKLGKMLYLVSQLNAKE